VNPVLDRIEQELAVYVRRDHARRRRRRSTAALVSTCVFGLAITGVGIAAVTSSPLQRLLGSDTPLAKQADTAPVELHVADDAGFAWTMTAYVSIEGAVASAVVADGATDRLPAGGAASGFALAWDLRDGPLASDGLDAVRSKSDGREHYLLTGLVAADIEHVDVLIEGRDAAAQLSLKTITVPVERPEGVANGHDGAQVELPDQVSVRAFAAPLPPDLLAGKEIVRGQVVATWADGSKQTQETAPFCVSTSCGDRIDEVP
jgi:hypothetical protein